MVLSKISPIATNPISHCTWLPNQVPSELIMCFVMFAVCPACVKELLAIFMIFTQVPQLELEPLFESQVSRLVCLSFASPSFLGVGPSFPSFLLKVVSDPNI